MLNGMGRTRIRLPTGMLRRALVGLVIAGGACSEPSPVVAIRAAEPTHLLYTPTPNVNPPWCLVAGLHELSFSFPGRLQLQFSLFDNIGRINLGAKFGINDNLSVGAGMAHSLLHLGRGTHGVPDYANPRFGAFLCFGPQTDRLTISFTPHTQVGDHASVGMDFGFMATPTEWWSLIWEVGTSLDLTAYKYSADQVRLYLNTDGGVRIHPPSLPFLTFDVGVDMNEFPVIRSPEITVSPYIDVNFAMVVR